MLSRLLCLVALACVLVISVEGSAAADKIISLPGYTPGPAKFDQYAGYVTVDEKAGRALFYWFVESQNNPATDPVVIWLTGGPGCSGLAALLGENGPFQPKNNYTVLENNPWSWNRISNVIYIESPAGVGFSYSNTTSDYNTGDKRTADDSYNFIQGFMKRFPQFKDNDFWITGESYGGHYVPNLALRILEGNDAGVDPKINLKGFQVGNPWTYMPIDNLGCITDWYTHALMPKTTYEKIKNNCDLTDLGPLKRDVQSAACDAALAQSTAEMGNIDIYDIYIDVCLSRQNRYFIKELANAGSTVHRIVDQKLSTVGYPVDPCVDKHMTEYLNLVSVQSAIHAKHGRWNECGGVQYNYSDVRRSVIPEYKTLFSRYPDVKILVYSGDVDGIVPYPGTRAWVLDFNQTELKPWTPWYDATQQVGGYATIYEKFTFSTVRNAGHQVPFYQPQRSWYMFSKFLTGQPF